MAKQMVTLQCSWCGEPFQRIKFSADQAERRGMLPYCSRSHAKYANPSTNPATMATDAERIAAKIEVVASGCWEWSGARNGYGYGRLVMRVDGRIRERVASRVSWEVANGPIPEGMEVCHTCDNPPCVRPDHLFLGTHADNMADMSRKGRASRKVA